MTPEDARKLLQGLVEGYHKGIYDESFVIHRLYYLAAVIEAEEILAAVPEGVRLVLQKDAALPLPKFEEDNWFMAGVSVRRGEPTEEEIKASLEADKARYRGHCRLHEYLNRRG
ncbi:hypothetical protein [Pedosphaera parvula]|uniref:Uncharacterized protein n=1 Tax=Pedosphaera parvula (strain Ellin514) TaxID=320771 RepID=B9XEP3_PEDPL|nr:hypothetical protein [Pedosphaera parvula]EEF61757.1 hypothetical protein Cflav_PD4797 [Pedosphaera parvula Ellin514]